MKGRQPKRKRPKWTLQSQANANEPWILIFLNHKVPTTFHSAVSLNKHSMWSFLREKQG